MEKALDEQTLNRFMGLAIEEAKKSLALVEVPVGAVVVCEGEVVSAAYNTRETEKNAVNHAELLAISAACQKLGGWRLHKCDLYVTLEPCPMCAGAIVNSRIKRVVFGAKDPKSGAFGSVIDLNAHPFNHKPEIISGVREEECAAMLSDFFRALREKNNYDKKIRNSAQHKD
ncbi:MAG: tRNA adenosine(34) deaminase TadA [Clostridia bacterium]|nr:tRNA adenosine(34) deaminase TadA [Clostridia bacterium]